MITPIDKLQPLAGIAGKDNGSRYDIAGSEYGTFGSVFQSAIDYVEQTDSEKREAEYLLATGQLDNPSVLMIASAKNQIAVDLLVQLRNKAVDAYSELTRMTL